jgi:predicted GNAT family acetyltransferase
MERSKVKDLVNRIHQHIDDYNQAELPETAPALSGVDSSAEPEPAPSAKVESSLLPEEVINKDYDKELFQIFIGQVQENISLLRTLTDSFPDAPNQTKIIRQCSDLAGKLQSSANYMSYDRLADFYLQWVAELEMAGVELSMGNPVNFDFMDQHIKKIAELFPEINDKPADPAELQKAEEPSIRPPAEASSKEKEFSADADDMQEMFGALDEIEDEEFDGEEEPIAALSGEITPEEEEAMAAGESSKPLAVRRQSRGKKTIEIDSSFLEEEKQSEGYDEELFQIFVQQLQENISQLQNLTDSFAGEANKSNIIDKCSNLVGKLQSSANYMGYERLAEFYLQWIAELEMTGVELSIGSDISFDFMQEKIDRIAGLFPEAGGSPSARPHQRPVEKTPVPEPVIAREEISGPVAETAYPDDREIAKVAGEVPVPESAAEIFEDDEDEDEEEPLAEGIEPIAGLSDEELEQAGGITGAIFDEQPEAADVDELERGEFSEAVDEKPAGGRTRRNRNRCFTV